MGKILLFYKYVDIAYPKQILKWQKQLCQDLGLKGRIILAHEGINGTVGGSQENIELYAQAMRNHELFADIDLKISDVSTTHFPRLRIVIREQIVNFGIAPDKVHARDGGIHVSPEQAHALMEKHTKDLIIIDCRNTYETEIGSFVGALKPNTKNFRDFPAYVDANLDQFKDKEVLMACTGGIRCERASAYLKLKNVAKKVYQISGGIHRYCEKFPDGFFRGKNYVFDGRVTVPVTNDILGKCTLCDTLCDEYTNCLRAACNKHFICCASCIKIYKNTCSQQCQERIYNHNEQQRPLVKTTPYDSIANL